MQPLPQRPKLNSGPSRHVYDVIVVGGQVAGALAAALLAKRSYRVLLVEHDGLGTGYEHGEFILPYAPFIMPPLRAMPGVEDAFTELGLTTTIQRALKPHHPSLQLILPKHRLDLLGDEGRRLAELKREFGTHGTEIEQSLRKLALSHEASDSFFRKPVHFPPDGMMEGWSLKREIKRHPALEADTAVSSEDPALKLVLGLAGFVTYSADVKPLSVGRTVSQIFTAPNKYPGGREGLRELLCKKLLDLGGDYLGPESAQSAVVENLCFEGSKLVGLKVMESENIYRGNVLIAATDSGALRRLIVDKKKHRDLSESLELVSTKRFLYSVNWVLPADVLPRGMGELLAVDTDSDLGPLLVQTSPVRKVNGKVEDESARVICAAASVPAGARDLGEAHLQKLAERIGGYLDRLMPFAKARLLASSAPYLDAGGVRGSRLLPHPLYSVETEQHLGVTGAPAVTPVKNLLLASREVIPGLGLEGELLASLLATERVQELLKKKDPLRR